MRHYFLLILAFLMLGGISASAQELRVTDIKEVTNSIKARTANVRDLNGDLCALVEVAAPRIDGLVFDESKVIGSVSHSGGVYSLYIPAGTKSIGFRHDNYLPGTINFAGNGITISGGSTYSVSIQLPDSELQQNANASAEYQYLVINVMPASAVVEIDGSVQNVNDGSVSMLVQVGSSHHYKVSASGMLTEEGDVTIGSKKREVNIALRENLAHVSIASLPDAEIYANERLLGKGQWTGTLAPGTYRMEARMNGAVISDEIHNIVMNGDKTETIELKVLYGKLDINANTSNVSIFLDNSLIGATPLLQQALPGSHEIRAAKTGYNVVLKTVNVTSGETEAVKLEMTPVQQHTTESAAKPEKEKQAKTSEPKPQKAQAPAKTQQPQVPAKTHPAPAPKPVKAAKATTEKPLILAGAELGYAPGSGEMSYGAKVGFVKTVGGYVSARSNFNSCDAGDKEYKSSDVVWKNSDYQATRLNATAGLIVHAFGPVYPYVGAGYGVRNLYGEMAKADGLALISDHSYSGVAVEGGLMMKMGPVMISIGMNTVAFKYGDFELGVCVAF